MMRFKPSRSIKGMLLIVLLPSSITLMAIAWFIHGVLLETMSREFIERQLQNDVEFLRYHLEHQYDDFTSQEAYLNHVFHHAFALVSDHTVMVSPNAYRPLMLPLLANKKDGYVKIHNTEIPHLPKNLLVYQRSLLVHDQPMTLLVAADMSELTHSQASLHTWTAIVSFLMIVLLAAVIWWGIHLSMRPVTHLKIALKALQDGAMTRIEAQAPEEFRPLIVQLNQLLDSLDQRLEHSREALANLSHSVKTPIAALRQILEDTERSLDVSLRQEMAARLATLDKQLESEMRRSRFAGPHIGKHAFPVKQARDLLWMLGRLYTDKSFELTTTLAETTRWPIEEQDLNEILGNLLDNAGKWSNSYVELKLEEHAGRVILRVLDDGVGVAQEEKARLGQRGRRLDEQMPGHGLGLAIVSEIVSRYEGEMAFLTAPQGGLNVQITFKI